MLQHETRGAVDHDDEWDAAPAAHVWSCTNSTQINSDLVDDEHANPSSDRVDGSGERLDESSSASLDSPPSTPTRQRTRAESLRFAQEDVVTVSPASDSQLSDFESQLQVCLRHQLLPNDPNSHAPLDRLA